MDILMTYWKSVWRTESSKLYHSHAEQEHSADEQVAYRRQMGKTGPGTNLMRQARLNRQVGASERPAVHRGARRATRR